MGVLITDARELLGRTQADIAEDLGVKQQTVSRWESGATRPRRDMALRLSELLALADKNELLHRANYPNDDELPSLPVRPLLKRLPLAGLRATDFEAFCRDFIKTRHRAAEVHRFGNQGHTQDGIDLIARLADDTQITYQCKRVRQFGADKVAKVVKATMMRADLHYLLLSRVASPGARKETSRHKGWILEDVDDISSAVRFDFALDDARRLVDTYFPGWRQEFLGIPRPGQWMTTAEFFRPALKPNSIISHGWALVGRQQELVVIDEFMSSDAGVLVVAGRGGAGKSRFLREVADRLLRRTPSVAVRFLAPEMSFESDEIEHLPPDPLVIIVDDAHDRDDIRIFLGALSRADRNVKLIIATRPYSKDKLLADLSITGFLGIGDNAVLDLSEIEIRDLERLAKDVLIARAGPVDAADLVARATCNCPMFTVIAAQLVASGEINPHDLGSDDTIRSYLMATFRDAILGELGEGSESAALRELVHLIALIQPVITDTDDFRSVAESMLDQRLDRTLRRVRVLEEAGVLLRRGRKLRVVPDLLADFLVADACVDPHSGAPTGYADLVFAGASGSAAEHVILNIAKLDWRVSRERDLDTRVLDRIWDTLTDRLLAQGIPERRSALEALSDVSYYQPRRSLLLARALLNDPIVELDVKRVVLPSRFLLSYDYVLEALPSFLRGAAFHMDFVGEVCDLLWQLGRNQIGALHSHPNNPVRILQDLASIDIGKPIEISSRIIERAIAWTDDSDLSTYTQSPFDVMKVVVATEGHHLESRGWTLTLKPFTVNLQAIRPLRNRVVDHAISLLDHDDVRIAVRAAALLEDALHYPSGLSGRPVNQKESDLWTPEFVSILQRIASHVRLNELDPIIEDRLRSAVNWHVRYSDTDTKQHATAVITLFNSDLNARLTQALAHGWAHFANLPEEEDSDYDAIDKKWRESQRKVAFDLHQTVPNETQAVDMIAERLNALKAAEPGNPPSPGPFLTLLFEEWILAASEVLDRAIRQPDGPLSDIIYSALLELYRQWPDKSVAITRRVMATGVPDLTRQAASALLWTARIRKLRDEELKLIVEFATDQDESVRLNIAGGLRHAVTFDQSTRIGVVMAIHIGGISSIAEEVVGNFGKHGDLKLKDLSPGQIRSLLAELTQCDDIGSYQIGGFLAAVSATDPDAVLQMLRSRVAHAEKKSTDFEYRPVPYEWGVGSPLQFRDSPDFVGVIQQVCDWFAEPHGESHREFWTPLLFAAVVGRIDDTVLDALSGWAGSSDPARLETISHLYRHAPRVLVWTKSDWVIKLLERADALGIDCFDRVTSGLYSSVVSGGRSGKPGEPFPEDIEQRDRSLEAVAKLSVGSPAHRFYTSLVKSAEASIHWSAERDAERFLD